MPDMLRYHIKYLIAFKIRKYVYSTSTKLILGARARRSSARARVCAQQNQSAQCLPPSAKCSSNADHCRY